MASELKPCLLCEGEAKLLRRSGTAGRACPSKWYRERVECKVCGLTTREYKKPGAAAHSWNTRPAPAATDTGLVTVAYQYKFGDIWLLSDAPKVMRKAGYELREVVTRENAEAVIANVEAEKAKAIKEAGKHFAKTCMMAEDICNLKEASSQAEKLLAAKDEQISAIAGHLDCEADSDSILHTIREIEADKAIYKERAEKAEADNAAQAARIKETEDCYLRLCEAIGVTATNAAPIDASEKLRALEAKLAAAQKALEPFADIAGEPWADENGWTDAACQNDRIVDWFGPSAFLAARAALGGKPS